MSTPISTTGIVKAKYQMTETTYCLDIDLAEKLDYMSGQFVMIGIVGHDEIHAKPYSITSAPWEEGLSFCVKSAGETSGAITSLEIGDEIIIKGPRGHFVLPKEENKVKRYLFISQGTGMATFRSMIRTLFEKTISGKGEDTKKEVSIIFGARTTADILYHKEFTELAAEKSNFKYFVVLSRQKHELEGYVQHHIEKLQIDKNCDIFICGMKAMAEDVKARIEEKGLEPHHMYTELYG